MKTPPNPPQGVLKLFEGARGGRPPSRSLVNRSLALSALRGGDGGGGNPPIKLAGMARATDNWR